MKKLTLNTNTNITRYNSEYSRMINRNIAPLNGYLYPLTFSRFNSPAFSTRFPLAHLRGFHSTRSCLAPLSNNNNNSKVNIGKVLELTLRVLIIFSVGFFSRYIINDI